MCKNLYRCINLEYWCSKFIDTLEFVFKIDITIEIKNQRWRFNQDKPNVFCNFNYYVTLCVNITRNFVICPNDCFIEIHNYFTDVYHLYFVNVYFLPSILSYYYVFETDGSLEEDFEKCKRLTVDNRIKIN